MAKNRTVNSVSKKKQAEEILAQDMKGDVTLEQKKTELIEAKENYHRLCREFIDLWSKSRRAHRQ